MNREFETRSYDSTGIGRLQTVALVFAIVGVIGCVIGWMSNPQEFFRAYLPAYIFWFLIGAGSLGVLMLQYTTGGEWGVILRRRFWIAIPGRDAEEEEHARHLVQEEREILGGH